MINPSYYSYKPTERYLWGTTLLDILVPDSQKWFVLQRKPPRTTNVLGWVGSFSDVLGSFWLERKTFTRPTLSYCIVVVIIIVIVRMGQYLLRLSQLFWCSREWHEFAFCGTGPVALSMSFNLLFSSRSALCNRPFQDSLAPVFSMGMGRFFCYNSRHFWLQTHFYCQGIRGLIRAFPSPWGWEKGKKMCGDWADFWILFWGVQTTNQFWFLDVLGC